MKFIGVFQANVGVGGRNYDYDNDDGSVGGGGGGGNDDDNVDDDDDDDDDDIGDTKYDKYNDHGITGLLLPLLIFTSIFFLVSYFPYLLQGT